MARVIFEKEIPRPVNREGLPVHVVAFRPGDQLYVQNIVGSTYQDFATLVECEDGWCEVTFDKHALTTVEDYWREDSSCVNLPFVRPNRPSSERLRNVDGERKRKVLYSKVIDNRLYAAALYAAGYEPVWIPGGAENYGLAFSRDENGRGAEVMVAAPTRRQRERGMDYRDCPRVFIVTNEQLDQALYDLRAQNEVEAGDTVRVDDARAESPEVEVYYPGRVYDEDMPF